MNDNYDHSGEPLPARRAIAPPLAPPHAEYQDDYIDPAAPRQNRGFTGKILWRAFKRHWWFAVPAWLVISAVLMFLAFTKIKPTFDAISDIRVEQENAGIFTDRVDASRADFATYLQTQVSTITSPTVVETALTKHPELMSLEMLKNSKEPAVDIKKNLKVGIVDRTNLIRVELSSQHPGETADIVNAVVDAYLGHAQESFSASTEENIKWLKGMQKDQLDKVKSLRTQMTELTKNIGANSVKAIEDRTVTTLDTYHRYMEEWTTVRIKRIATKAKIEQLKSDAGLTQTMDTRVIDAEVDDAFHASPQVANLEADLVSVERKLAAAQRLTRSGGDPTVQLLRQRSASLKADLEALRKKLNPMIRRRVMASQTDGNSQKTIDAAQAELAAMQTQEETLEDWINKIKIENKDSEGKGLQLEFLRGDMLSEELVLKKIQERLNERTISQRSPIARVAREFAAKPSRRPNAERRNQAVILAPFATGFALLLLIVMLELRGARVNDPEELSARMNLQVIGVVPPLPQLRSSSSGNGSPSGNGIMSSSEMKAQRQLDEFVQSLDHLRVALCARKDPWGRDKHCVLITSACGSEGKTTLAAQLAERCVNAGLMTLLIDADLRNPTLSRMLDAADSPGLINVLRGEMLAEDVVVVVGDAGGFHLLPAGTPKMDPSRLLQGDRLGKLLAQARESFDMIIVDAPPVLPVPDALTIGKWTDGAVLAVRYDTSRFPLVERANRRLAHVGVPVIGAVVNGVRSMESAYGGYYAYGGYGSNAPASESVSSSTEE